MLEVYSDGSASDRRGHAGGWAFVVVRGGEVLGEGSGGARSATNNVMELEAAMAGIRAARALGAKEEIQLVSDSRVTLDALREDPACADISLRWVRGHSGNVWNERVDAMAHAAKQQFLPARVRRKQAARSP